MQFGEGLIGQCAMDKRQRLVSDIPSNAVPINSALVRVVPKNVVVLPILFENQVKGRDRAGLPSAPSRPSQMTFLEQLTDSIGIVLNSIEATMQTEGLLKQSQQLAESCRHSKKNCSRPTSSSSKRLSSLPNATSRWSARTRKSSRHGARWKRRRPNFR
jgi:hypothetical protein